MKAIIIAAGMGKRMKPLTDSLPKCMLDFNGRTLLERHLDTLRSCGIDDITVIRGYKGDKINLEGVKYYTNDRYEYNNILNSLFYAEYEMNDDVIITYSDIFYEKPVLNDLIEFNHDISIVVDVDWYISYVGRDAHPIKEAENVRMTSDGKVVEIGKILKYKNTVDGEFIGMLKLSKKGCKIFREIFHEAKNKFWGKPFQSARIFEQAYLTDMIQELVDRKIDVHCLLIRGGWKEIDTIQDYDNTKKIFIKR